MILLACEHVYVITAWYLIDFSKMNDNENVLFEILLLSRKLLHLATWKFPIQL